MPSLSTGIPLIADFVQAKNFTRNDIPPRDVRLIVVHTMEAPEKPRTARNVAEWFAGPNAPIASAHFCIDDQEIVQCVKLDDISWAAPGANGDGVHLEHAGYAGQTDAAWDDDYSRSVLWNSAKVAAELSRIYGIPIEHVDPGAKDSGARGFCGHVDVTNARNGGKGHQDPGPRFPWERYLALVKEHRLSAGDPIAFR